MYTQILCVFQIKFDGSDSLDHSALTEQIDQIICPDMLFQPGGLIHFVQ